MRISTKFLFGACYGKYAIPAVNIFTMEQALGLFMAAQASGTPIIVQITPAARNYTHPKMLSAMISAASEIYNEVVYSVHLDHGTEEHIFDALQTGDYDSVMIDASFDDFETNIKRTQAIVEDAHLKNKTVEAELGVLSGVEDEKNIDEKHSKYTDPDKVLEFINRTHCDSLAVAVGTSHGAYKFNSGKGLQLDVLSRIQQKVQGFPLVLHGSSSIKKNIVQEINKFGGTLASGASGVTDDDLIKAIKSGVCKVNIATDLRLLWTKVHRKFFAEHSDLFDPIKPGKEYMEDLKDFMIRKFEVLNAAGKSKEIRSNL